MKQSALFPAPAVPDLVLSQHFAARAKLPNTISNHGLRGHVACEECIWVLHEAKGKGQPPRSAGRKAVLKDYKPVLLCGAHASMWTKKAAR